MENKACPRFNKTRLSQFNLQMQNFAEFCKILDDLSSMLTLGSGVYWGWEKVFIVIIFAILIERIKEIKQQSIDYPHLIQANGYPMHNIKYPTSSTSQGQHISELNKILHMIVFDRLLNLTKITFFGISAILPQEFCFLFSFNSVKISYCKKDNSQRLLFVHKSVFAAILQMRHIYFYKMPTLLVSV